MEDNTEWYNDHLKKSEPVIVDSTPPIEENPKGKSLPDEIPQKPNRATRRYKSQLIARYQYKTTYSILNKYVICYQCRKPFITMQRSKLDRCICPVQPPIKVAQYAHN